LLQSSNAAANAIADRVAQLKQAPNQVARLALLNDSDFVFSFVDPPAGSGESTGLGGRTVAASASNFPALIGNDMAATVGFLGPCAMNTPHTHPRATEFNFVTNGTLTGGLLSENGAKFIINKIPAGSATIFPMGAIHFEFNNDCEPSTFAAFFNDVDPGVLQLAQRFFGLPPDIVDASLGGIGVMEVAGLADLIPDNIILGLDECVKRCGITRGQDLFKQQQPRVQANALPSGYGSSAPVPPSTPTSTSTSATSSSTNTSAGGDITGLVSQDSTTSDGSVLSTSDPNRPLIIGLIVAVCVMGLGYIGLAIAALMRRRKSLPVSRSGGSYVQTGEQFAPVGLYEGEKYELGRPSGEELRTPYDPPSGSH